MKMIVEIGIKVTKSPHYTGIDELPFNFKKVAEIKTDNQSWLRRARETKRKQQ